MKELIVYPTPYLVKQHRAKQLENKIGVTGVLPVTYEIFIEKCIQEVISNKIFLGDFKKEVIVYQILVKLKKENKLKYFHTLRQGYVQRIADVIGELKQQDIDVETFKSLNLKGFLHHDFYLVYKTYQDLLERKHLYDREDRYLICKDTINRSNFLARWDLVTFKDFFEFTPIQNKIISAIGNKGKSVNSNMEMSMQEIEVIKAQNRRTEVYNLAHVILEDLKRGMAAEKVCIVLRNQDAYVEILHEVFEEAQVPINLGRQTSLVQNPFIKSLLSLFKGELSSYFSEKFSYTRGERNNILQWSTKLKEYLHDQGYPVKFSQIHNTNLGVIKRDLEAFDALKGLLTELEDLYYILMIEDMNYQDFVNLLKNHIHSRVYSYKAPDEGIWVLPPTMLRGLYFDKIYVLGMIDGEFPRDFRPDWFLKEWEREVINRKDFQLDTLDILLDKESRAFSFLTACSPKGYFSYPIVVEDNTSSIVSPFLEELIELYSCSVETVRFDSVYCQEKINDYKPCPGIINDGKIKEGIKKLFNQRPFSTTAFNMYGQCPYKFFLARVLNLSPSEEEDQFTALARGTILHKILEVFFKNHRKGLKSDKIDEYTNEIKRLVDDIMGESAIENSFPHRMLYEIEKNEISESIINYIKWYIKQRGNFNPILFEFGFGYKKEFCPDFAPDISICGKIDRIDEDSEGKLIVFDYKSSSTPDIKEVKEGTDIQLPLYILSAEQLLEKPVVGGAFISLKKGSVDNVLVRDGSNLPFISKRRKKGVLNEKEWDDLMETVKRTVREYTDNIRESKFPLKPKKCPKISNYGSFCDFVNICPWEGEDQ
ncbi:MAG TPA: hypothetical protein GX723_08580 [Thermoanaerobacterales bacterium]|nr:hypothetical protein [Thermoanaerobacterales bacterium]